MKTNWGLLAKATAVCGLAGVIGSFFTSGGITPWYSALAKPAWTPPSWVFAPVWTALYALMGVALYLVLAAKGGRERKAAIGLFAVQLVLNVAWSAAFFGARSILLGLAVIILLDAAIVATTIQFGRVDRRASMAMLPYLAWSLFATALNYGLWARN